ncbi:hypothetical protein [Micromonospora sp. CMU55-4]|uniref:hypothetical protein n=1 Tax=Micromonospora sp. CMU55-4 TaxID=2717028 RepID=UPI00140B2E6B|nr:hypothetical protein [Micromonospora sp. CMU55-4]
MRLTRRLTTSALARRALSGAAAVMVASAGLVAVDASVASATPPGIPSKSSAQSQLNALTVKSEGLTSGYSRDLFPHWITISGACNTRRRCDVLYAMLRDKIPYQPRPTSPVPA